LVDIFSLQIKITEVKDCSAKAGQVAFILSLNGLKHARTRTKPVKDKSAFFDDEFNFEWVLGSW
jgi:hypothetical protein